jgi:ribosomal protein S27AE
MTANLATEYELACPRCGQADALQISITCLTELTIDGSDPCGDHAWDDASFCRCPECGHGADVAAFSTRSTEVQP